MVLFGGGYKINQLNKFTDYVPHFKKKFAKLYRNLRTN